MAAGLILRLILVFASENRLDCDEAVIAVMGLDVLDGARPFFVYHTSYDGGGAFEAYLSAIGFALFGPSALVVKLIILSVWTLAALLFAGLCRRMLGAREAFLAVLLFMVATPFFLEWSVKARGGYAETLFMEIALLYLAAPPAWIGRRPPLAPILFGISIGIGIWLSEMLLPMIFPALLWFFLRRKPGERRRALLPLAMGTAVGYIPLLAYNITHDWANLRQSVLAQLLSGPGGIPLTLEQMAASARFILGPLWWFALIAMALSAALLAGRWRNISLAHIFLLHAALYVLGYYLGGLRYLEIPPARILFPIYPAMAVLVATALSSVYGEGKGAFRKAISISLVVIWIGSAAPGVYGWIASEEPREAGSWRGTWSLADGTGLYEVLAADRTQIAFMSYWTYQNLEFGKRSALYKDPASYDFRASYAIPPDSYRPGSRAAFVLLTGSPLLQETRNRLNAWRIDFEQSEWNDYTILTGLDTGRIHTGAGFPATLTEKTAFPPMPAIPDGFN